MDLKRIQTVGARKGSITQMINHLMNASTHKNERDEKDEKEEKEERNENSEIAANQIETLLSQKKTETKSKSLFILVGLGFGLLIHRKRL